MSLTFLPREIRHCIINCVFNAGRKQQFLVHAAIYGKRRYCCQQCISAKAIRFKCCACFGVVGGYSTTCTCAYTRLALFRVSKTLCEDSMHVLFSTSRVILHSVDTSLKFFSNLPNCALEVLRIIHIHIHGQDHGLFIAGDTKAVRGNDEHYQNQVQCFHAVFEAGLLR